MDLLQPDGILVAEVMLKDRIRAILKNDTLIKSIQGKRVAGGGVGAAPLPDGTVQGGLGLEDGKRGPFFWYGEEVHIPFMS